MNFKKLLNPILEIKLSNLTDLICENNKGVNFNGSIVKFNKLITFIGNSNSGKTRLIRDLFF